MLNSLRLRSKMCLPKAIGIPCSGLHSTKIANTSAYTMISFFKFFPIVNPEQVIQKTKEEFSARQYKGTLYVAKEGINGAFCIPTYELDHFQHVLSTVVGSDLSLNIGQALDENYTEIPTSAKKFGRTADTKVKQSKRQPPFKKLLIKERAQVLTDGLFQTNHNGNSKNDTDNVVVPEALELDWFQSGIELDPHQWHESISTGLSSSDTIIIDCRNKYESDLGRFEGSISLNTRTFSDSWSELDRILSKKDKLNTKILTYCTGGIRCVKTNAYITQKLGFQSNHVKRLKHGIIAYENWVASGGSSNVLDDSKSIPISHWKGKNFLFDRRRLHDSICERD